MSSVSKLNVRHKIKPKTAVKENENAVKPTNLIGLSDLYGVDEKRSKSRCCWWKSNSCCNWRCRFSVPRPPVTCDSVVTVGSVDDVFLAAAAFTDDNFATGFAIINKTILFVFSLHVLCLAYASISSTLLHFRTLLTSHCSSFYVIVT